MSWARIARIGIASVALVACLCLIPFSARAAVESKQTLSAVLARYQAAMNDPGAASLAAYETSGVLAGARLSGTFHEWNSGDRQRTDSNLGPRGQRTLRLGDRYWVRDENGIVRELTGVLARRSRTQALIDSGDFATQPQDCVLRGRANVDGALADVLDVTALGGDTETLYLAADTGLPLRLAYDDDDARGTVDLSDWRTIAGHRFAYKSVASDGDREFDTTQLTQSVSVVPSFDPSTFTPLVGRTIEMTGAQTVPLTFRGGHLFVATRIGGRDYTFLVDTGAQNIVLDKHVADQLKLATAGDLEASGAKRTGGLQLVRIDEFDIGAGKLRDLVATTINLHSSTGGAFTIDGVLGYPFFASALVKIDPANRSMTFGPPGSFTPKGEKLVLDVDRAIPEVRFAVNHSVVAPFIVDTGNGAELLLYKPFVDHHLGIVPYSQNTRSSYGIGGITGSYRTTLDELDVGASPLYHLDTDVMQATRGAFADRFDAGNVGLAALENFVLTFDYTNSTLYVVRAATYDDGRTRI